MSTPADNARPAPPGRVFISYSHDSEEHRARVLELCDGLRREGVDAWIDRYEQAPPEGWARWTRDQLEAAHLVIVVCTETYTRRFEGRERPGVGRGVTWEGLLATQQLYEAGAINHKLVPVLFDVAGDEVVPTSLRAFQRYRLPGEYDSFYRRLTGQPEVVPPGLGERRRLPPVQARPAVPHQEVRSGGERSPDPEVRPSDDLARTDVFLSFAGPARRSDAVELAGQLEERGYSAALSTTDRDVSPASFPAPVVSNQARLVVVLLSRDSESSTVQRQVVEQARAGNLPMLPVDLDLPRAQRPFGLEAHAGGIDARRMNWGEIAARVVSRLENPEPSTSWSPSVPRPVQRSYGEVFHGAALRVDRKDQWEPVVSTCRGDQSCIFLLRGARRQNLEFFMWRVTHYLIEAAGRHHAFHFIRLRDGEAVPRSTAAWEHQVRIALGGGEGTAEQLLRDAARHQPVFLVLRKRPLAHGDLEKGQLSSLEKFLSGPLPEMMTAAGRTNPIRMLLGVHYDEHSAEEQKLERRLDEALRRGCADGTPKYWPLKPLKPVEWLDVEDYLNEIGLASRKVCEKVRRAFDELNQRNPSFEDLTRMLDAMLDD